MLKIKSKYKISKRLGAPVFEKCQTQKFTLSLAKKDRNRRTVRRRKSKTSYGLQLIEKQKARYTYVISEKQFRGYVNKALSSKDLKSTEKLYELLESRLDNVVYRLGFAKTRMMSRQIVSHGHIMVNDKKLNIPSYLVKKGDKILIKKASGGKILFRDLNVENVPKWLSVDVKKMEGEVKGTPEYDASESIFNLQTVIEFYNR